MISILVFTIGLVVGVCFVLLFILLYALMNVSGQISQEEQEMLDWRKKKGME